MSSEYEFHSYITANQLQKERARKDKKIVEVILEKNKTGLSISDYMRDDIFHGVTHSINRYNKLGIKYWFGGHYMFTDMSSQQAVIEQFLIEDGARQATDFLSIQERRRGLISQLLQSLSTLSQNDHELRKKEHTEQGDVFTGYIEVDGHTWHMSEYIIDEISGNIIIPITRWDGTNKIEDEYDTGLPGKSTQQGDKIGVVLQYNVVSDIDLSYYFFSQDTKYREVGNTSYKDMKTMPFVSLKDDQNDEKPYYLLDEKNVLRRIREKTLSAINVKLKDVSKNIFEGQEIPELNSTEWKSKFGKWYKHDSELKEQFSTEQEYHDDLVEKNENQDQSIRQVSDAHIGFAVTPLYINELSAYAAYFTLKPLLLEYKHKGPVKIRVGSLRQTWSFHGVRIVRKQGVPKNIYDTATRVNKNKTKTGWYIKSFSKKKDEDEKYVHDENHFTEEGIGGDDDDPILETLTEVGVMNPPSTEGREKKTIYELRVITAPNEYTEIRIVGWQGVSTTTQKHNPDYPDGEIVTTSSVDLCDIYDTATFINGLLVPLTFKAFKSVPIFKRDRLTKETLMIVVQGVAVSETPWYATLLFKIFMIVLIVVATIIFAPAGQVGAALLSLGMGMAASYALSYIAKMVKSPLLMGIITFAVGLIMLGGAISMLDMISLAVEATGTYMNQKIMIKELEVRKKTREAEEHRNKLARDVKKLEDKFGLNKESNTKYLLYLASLPPVEHPDDFFGRALNTNLNEINMTEPLKLPDIG